MFLIGKCLEIYRNSVLKLQCLILCDSGEWRFRKIAFEKQRRKYNRKNNTERNAHLQYTETLELYQQTHRLRVQDAKESVIKIHHSFNKFISKFLLEILTLWKQIKRTEYLKCLQFCTRAFLFLFPLIPTFSLTVQE